jgi:hypothetical protein
MNSKTNTAAKESNMNDANRPANIDTVISTEVQCEGVGWCNAYTDDGERLWYNSRTPTGCAFIPKSREDRENLRTVIENNAA